MKTVLENYNSSIPILFEGYVGLFDITNTWTLPVIITTFFPSQTLTLPDFFITIKERRKQK